MQLQPPISSGATAKLRVSADADPSAKIAPVQAQSRFNTVLTQYSATAGAEGPPDANPGLAPPGKSSIQNIQGQILPLRQTSGLPPDSAEQVLADLDEALNDITDTVTGILALEEEAASPQVGPVTTLLVNELGYSKEEAADLIDTLQIWMAGPPQVAVSAEKLAAQGPDTVELVQSMSDSLASLGDELASWLQQIEVASAAQSIDVGPVSSELLQTSAPLPPIETLQQWSRVLNDGQGGLSRMIASIADRVKAVLNTANSASLPLTFDQSRPEFSLLVNENTTPAADTIFSQLLQVGTDKPTPDSDSALLTRLLPLAAAIADDVATPVSVGQPLLDKTDATVAVLQRSLHLPVVMSEAGRQLGERLALMVRGDIQQATIRLDPPELGLMDVRITVQNDQTQVQIVVQSPQVREALESQSVRLREFLEQQGLSLAQLDIRDQSAGQQQAGTGEHDEGSDEASSGLANENNQKEVDEAVSWQQGLVDHFV